MAHLAGLTGLRTLRLASTAVTDRGLEALTGMTEMETLVLLGTHGHGGLDRLVLGSVAATIARKSPCSVLMVSPDAAMAEGIAEAVATHFAPAFH